MKQKIIIASSALFLLIGVIYSFTSSKEETNLVAFDEVKEEKKEPNSFYVDLKGAVKRPGVYKVKKGDRVNDLIKMAGGPLKDANTSNINLSKKLKKEMVVYVYTDKEINKGNKALTCNTICDCEVIEINNCYEDDITHNNNKININTSSFDKLLEIPGVGEVKAKEIISYREKKKFTNIKDIMNISGIGEKTFEKIKDYITV